MIFALSPQAKGRVERAAGTFQDRLITELRLSGATTFEQARAVLKQFLPRFNRRFGVPAQCPEPVSRARIPALAGGPALGTSPVLQAPQESGQGQHREVPEAHPAAASRSKAPQLCRSYAAAMPGRLWWCWKDWTAGCQCSMRDASLLPRRRRPVRELSARPKGLSQPHLS